MRRVCCFCERWESGGIESFLYNVISRLDFTEIQVDIVAASLGESVFTHPLQSLGVHFWELSGSQHRLASNYRQFQALLHQRRWEVLHLNAFHGLSLHYLHLARAAGVPVRIAHSHNTDLRPSITRPFKLSLHRWACSRYTRDATRLWACSRNAAEFLFPSRTLARTGFQFIPNGVSTARFQYDPSVRAHIRAEMGLTGSFVIGNVGRLCIQKNQSFLLDVLLACLARRKESRLLLVGSGTLEHALREKAAWLGLSEQVLFCGNSRQVESLLCAMDAFVFPSTFEGLGIAAIEAQASGLPVLVSEHIPAEAKLTPLVYTVPLSSGPAAWADRLLSLSSAKDRIGWASQVRRAGFDISDVAHLLESVYKTS